MLRNIACLGAVIMLFLVVFLGHHGFQIPAAPLLLQTLKLHPQSEDASCQYAGGLSGMWR